MWDLESSRADSFPTQKYQKISSQSIKGAIYDNILSISHYPKPISK